MIQYRCKSSFAPARVPSIRICRHCAGWFFGWLCFRRVFSAFTGTDRIAVMPSVVQQIIVEPKPDLHHAYVFSIRFPNIDIRSDRHHPNRYGFRIPVQFNLFKPILCAFILHQTVAAVSGRVLQKLPSKRLYLEVVSISFIRRIRSDSTIASDIPFCTY